MPSETELQYGKRPREASEQGCNTNQQTAKPRKPLSTGRLSLVHNRLLLDMHLNLNKWTICRVGTQALCEPRSSLQKRDQASGSVPIAVFRNNRLQSHADAVLCSLQGTEKLMVTIFSSCVVIFETARFSKISKNLP